MCLRVGLHERIDKLADELRLRDASTDGAILGRLESTKCDTGATLACKMRDDDVQALARSGRALNEERGG